MAKDKKSVLLYCDIIHTVEKMDNETAGLFFKHYLRYINDLNPETDNMLVDISFESVKQNLKRDLKKWEKRAETSRINGSLGGRPPQLIKPKEPSGLIDNPTEPRKPVKDTVTVKDRVKVKDINKRKAEFKNSLQPFVDKYDYLMLQEFADYWTEHNEKGKKMRFEYSKNQPFNVSRRLATWLKLQKSFKKEKSSAEKETSTGNLNDALEYEQPTNI